MPPAFDFVGIGPRFVAGVCREFRISIGGRITPADDLPGTLPFLASDLGGPGGGAFSDWLERWGWGSRKARLTMMFFAACLLRIDDTECKPTGEHISAFEPVLAQPISKGRQGSGCGCQDLIGTEFPNPRSAARA